MPLHTDVNLSPVLGCVSTNTMSSYIPQCWKDITGLQRGITVKSKVYILEAMMLFCNGKFIHMYTQNYDLTKTVNDNKKRLKPE